jgi:hypothetical protein
LCGDEPAVVVVGGTHSGAVADKLAALARVVDAFAAAGRKAVMIGGVAVMARVASAERATGDIDTAVDGLTDAPPALAVLSASLGVPNDGQRVTVDGVVVDVIDTAPLTGDLEGYDTGQRLFLAGHRFAVETAELVELRAGAATCRAWLATSAGLVATKCHAVGHRSGGGAGKQASDRFDLYRLLDVLDWEDAAVALAAFPVLAADVAATIGRAFVDDATRAAYYLSTDGNPAMRTVRAEDLVAVAEGFLDTLRRAQQR